MTVFMCSKTVAISCSLDKFDFEKCCGLELRARRHSRPLEMTPFDRTHNDLIFLLFSNSDMQIRATLAKTSRGLTARLQAYVCVARDAGCRQVQAQWKKIMYHMFENVKLLLSNTLLT